jgi:riboflavin kinase/FMN adenylyltransferase
MNYVIKGEVVRGDGYGRKLGFPTVNLKTDTELLPPAGVYAGNAVLEDKRYRAGILINPSGKVEAHLIGYNGDAYGKEVTLEAKKFLREYKKFDTEKELIAQIGKDLEKC